MQVELFFKKLQNMGKWSCQLDNQKERKERITASGASRGKWQRICGGDPHHTCGFEFNNKYKSRIIRIPKRSEKEYDQ